jgi:hypothetical protein
MGHPAFVARQKTMRGFFLPQPASWPETPFAPLRMTTLEGQRQKANMASRRVSSVEGTSRLFVGVRGWPPGYDDGGDSSRPLLRACDQAICFRRVARRCWMRQSRIAPKWELKQQDSNAARR